MSRARLVLPAVVAALSLTARTAGAYFEDTAINARAIAMGGSILAIVDDVSAYSWNPAALARLRGLEFQADYGFPHGVADLSAGAVSAGTVVAGTGLAVGWHHLGIRGVFGEDLLSIGAGRQIARRGDHRLAAGATFKYGRISFEPFVVSGTGESVDYGSVGKGSLDVAAHWSTPWKLEAAWVLRDVLEPDYELIAGQGGATVERRYELGLGYRWHPESILTASWAQIDGTEGSFNLGFEVTFYDVFALRSGFTNVVKAIGPYDNPTELQFTGGFGVYQEGWMVDAAASTNRDLGASYRVSFRYNAWRTGS
jgi:hypothetical protein